MVYAYFRPSFYHLFIEFVIFGLIFDVYFQRLKDMCAIDLKIYVKRFLLVLGCLAMMNIVQAQTTRTPMEDMVNAIKNNRVTDMVRYFDSFVPITINNNQSIYSHNQAEVVLRDFFDKNNPKDFVILDNGSPDNTSKFIIGDFTPPNGVKYNVYILMRMKDGRFILQEIRINKE